MVEAFSRGSDSSSASETLISRLADVVRAQGSKPFVRCLRGADVTTMTFGDLWSASAQLGTALSRLGIRPGDTVAISLQSSTKLYAIFVACIRIGAVPTLMPFPNVKQDRSYFWTSHAKLFELTRISALITYLENAETLVRELGRTAFAVLVDDDLADPADAVFQDVEALPSDVAFLQHSSGTTGLKKGVMLAHDVVLRQVDDYRLRLRFGADDIVASWLPLYHDMGLITSFLLPMLTGATVIALDPFDWVAKPGQLLDAIQNFRATFCWMPNFAFQHLVRSVRPNQSWDLSSLRALINCSEPCRAETFDLFAVRFGGSGAPLEKLQVSYAMAETVFAVSQSPLGMPCKRIMVDVDAIQSRGRIVRIAEGGQLMLSCGPPLPGAAVAILGLGGERLGEAVVGEIVLSGSYLFKGYNQRPEITAQRLKDGYYSTGDLGFMLDGEIFVTGRIDDLIISYGRNFYAHEIEGCIVGISGLVPGRAIVLGVPDRQSGSQMPVLIAERDDPSVDVRVEIRRKVLEQHGLALSAVELVERGWLIKTTSGKISRQLNMKKYLSKR